MGNKKEPEALFSQPSPQSDDQPATTRMTAWATVVQAAGTWFLVLITLGGYAGRGPSAGRKDETPPNPGVGGENAAALSASPPSPLSDEQRAINRKIARATVVQAWATCILVIITFYYAYETRRIRSESTTVAQANREMADTNKEMAKTNIEMARMAERNLDISKQMAQTNVEMSKTAQINLDISKQMLASARDTLSEMHAARVEQMRPYLSYQSDSTYREGIGRNYFLSISNEGLMPAKDIRIKASSPKAPIIPSIGFLGPRQNSRILGTRSDLIKEHNIPTSFSLSISYKDLNDKEFQQTIDVELADEDPNSLSALREQLFKFNNTMDDIHLLMQNESRRRSEATRP